MNARGGATWPKYVAKPALRNRARVSGAQSRLADRRQQKQFRRRAGWSRGHGSMSADQMGVKEHDCPRGTDETHRGAHHGVRRALAGWVAHN
jgi:hypothetical protein